MNDGQTTLKAIAELIWARLSPGETDEPWCEIEDVIEQVKNSYCAVLWQLFFNNRQNEGQRTPYAGLLKRKYYDVAGRIDVSDITIVSLPHDAGIAQVVPVDKNKKRICDPYSISNSALAHMSGGADTNRQFFRIEDEVDFPDGHPNGTAMLEVLYIGFPDDEQLKVTRDIAELTYDKVWEKMGPTRGIPEDSTNNSNSNG